MSRIDAKMRIVEETIENYGLIGSGEAVLVGLSGGPDSMALLHILHRLRRRRSFTLGAAYINHRLRPRVALKEADFCRDICVSLDVPFYYEEIDVPRLAEEDRTGIEETARRYRYRELEHLADRHGYGKIAVGHHKDDRAETILFNLFRGTGRTGAVGFLPRRGRIIRPLYDLDRADIEAFLEAEALPSLTDRSNRSPRFARNRIRHRILSLAKTEISEAAVDNILRFSRLLEDENRFLSQKANRLYGKLHSTTPGGKNRLDLSHKSSYDIWLKRRLLLRLLGDAGIENVDFAHVERLLVAVEAPAGKRLQLPDGYFGEIAADHVYVYRPGVKIERRDVTIPGRYRLMYPHVTIDFEYIDPKAVTSLRAAQANTAYLDGDAIAVPVHIAGLTPGARIHPFGRPGSKKAGDFLTDRKYPRPLRDELPVVYDRRGIIWLAGLEIDNRVAVGPKTRKVVKIEVG